MDKEEEASSSSLEARFEDWDPWYPPIPTAPLYPSNDDIARSIIADEWCDRVFSVTVAYRCRSVIVPDPAPGPAAIGFDGIALRLRAILQKDSVRRFLRFFGGNISCLIWCDIITAETLHRMVLNNALRCAKVALEGREPELRGYRANPNCINRFGYFPLHQAAEMFSLDMIRLLLRHGASANVRTSGWGVTTGLLPLHVAIESTCQHKYLQGNWAGVHAIYKLIHLLCLPEMKIFLDTTRLIASHTDNLADELWHYIYDRKLVHAAILLLTAQKQIRGGPCCRKSNVFVNLSGFEIVTSRIWLVIAPIQVERTRLMKTDKRESEEIKQLVQQEGYFYTAELLVDLVSKAGEALDAYIQTHSEWVPHQEVLEHVSSILLDYGVASFEEGIDSGKLGCYCCDCNLSDDKSHEEQEDVDAALLTTSSPNLNIEAKKNVGKKLSKGWDLEDMRRKFFPFWRAVLRPEFFVKMAPPCLPNKEGVPSNEQISNAGVCQTKSTDEGAYPLPKHPGLAYIPQWGFNYKSRRLFGTAALTLLKALKRG